MTIGSHPPDTGASARETWRLCQDGHLMHEAFYIPSGAGRFESTPATAGPWSEELQHGGPPAALLAHVLERHEPAPELRAARITVDVLGPIPVAPLEVVARTIRPGRRIQEVGAELSANGRVVARASLWRLATLSGQPELLEGAPPPDQVPPLPESGTWTPDYPGGHFDGYLSAVEGRPVSEGVGAGTVWIRQRVPLVAGEETSPLSRTLVVADSGSGISVALNPAEYLFMNVDLSVALFRDPTGEWICLSARTTIGNDGTGLVNIELFDSDGAIGSAMQTLLVVPQPGSPTGSQ